MTIAEAENLYNQEIDQRRAQHTRSCKKAILIWNIVSITLIVVGIVLTIIGSFIPPEIDSTGFEWERGIYCMIAGIILLFIGTVWLITMNISYRKTMAKGPRDSLQQIKTLYYNYLKCDDMSQEHKEFYKIKLEDIRNMELVSAIHRASSVASAAIMFSMLNK